MQGDHVAAALLACLVLWSCAPSEPPAPARQATDAAAVERGRLVYEAEACGACHGERGEGTEVAPALVGLSASWQQEDLAAFLLDPGPALESDPRLAEMATRFDLEMPGIASASAEEASDLAEYLLSGPQ